MKRDLRWKNNGPQIHRSTTQCLGLMPYYADKILELVSTQCFRNKAALEVFLNEKIVKRLSLIIHYDSFNTHSKAPKLF